MRAIRFCFLVGLGVAVALGAPERPRCSSRPLLSEDYYSRIESIFEIAIKAPASVHPEALIRAKEIIRMMLQDIRPDIRERLASKGASLAIIPKSQYVTALPEFSYLSGRRDVNGNAYDSFKVRGLGAKSQPVSATSEENLLKLPDDPFKAEDITVHEFAHAIMNLGFAKEDIDKVTSLYKYALEKNLFVGSFAMVRLDEFWAELSQSFFNVNNEIGGPDDIGSQLPEALEFLRAIYSFSESCYPVEFAISWENDLF